MVRTKKKKNRIRQSCVLTLDREVEKRLVKSVMQSLHMQWRNKFQLRVSWGSRRPNVSRAHERKREREKYRGR